MSEIKPLVAQIMEAARAGGEDLPLAKRAAAVAAVLFRLADELEPLDRCVVLMAVRQMAEHRAEASRAAVLVDPKAVD